MPSGTGKYGDQTYLDLLGTRLIERTPGINGEKSRLDKGSIAFDILNGVTDGVAGLAKFGGRSLFVYLTNISQMQKTFNASAEKFFSRPG